MNPQLRELFGSRRRTQVLTLIALLEATYPTEIARLLGAPLYSVQRIVDALEAEGALVGFPMGKLRRIEVNKRGFAYRQLNDLLKLLGESDPEVRAAADSLRRSPRIKGKAI